jgi:hypothetical protein
MMTQAEFHEHVGTDHICPNIQTALEPAADLHRRQQPDQPAPLAL